MLDLTPWFSNARVIAEAIDEAGNAALAPLVCAIIRLESSGRHVYGNDAGGVFSTPGTKDIDVTYDNFHNEFLPRVMAGETSNGVGIMQITWANRLKDGTVQGGFFKEAADWGYDLSNPKQNVAYGIRKIASYLKTAGGVPTEKAVKYVGRRYNGSTAYGDRLWDEYKVWVTRLSAAPVDTTPPTPTPGPIPAPAPEFGSLVERLEAAVSKLESLSSGSVAVDEDAIAVATFDELNRRLVGGDNS